MWFLEETEMPFWLWLQTNWQVDIRLGKVCYFLKHFPFRNNLHRRWGYSITLITAQTLSIMVFIISGWVRGLRGETWVKDSELVAACLMRNLTTQYHSQEEGWQMSNMLWSWATAEVCSVDRVCHPSVTSLAWRGWLWIMTQYECDTAYYHSYFIWEVLA